MAVRALVRRLRGWWNSSPHKPIKQYSASQYRAAAARLHPLDKAELREEWQNLAWNLNNPSALIPKIKIKTKSFDSTEIETEVPHPILSAFGKLSYEYTDAEFPASTKLSAFTFSTHHDAQDKFTAKQREAAIAFNEFDQAVISKHTETVKAALTEYAVNENKRRLKLSVQPSAKIDSSSEQTAFQLSKAVFSKPFNTILSKDELKNVYFSHFAAAGEYSRDDLNFVVDHAKLFTEMPNPEDDIDNEIGVAFQHYLLEKNEALRQNLPEYSFRYIDIKKLRTLKYQFDEFCLMRKEAEAALSTERFHTELMRNRLYLYHAIKELGYDLSTLEGVTRFENALKHNLAVRRRLKILAATLGLGAGFFYSFSFISGFLGADGQRLIDMGAISELGRATTVAVAGSISIGVEMRAQYKQFTRRTSSIFRHYYPKHYEDIAERAAEGCEIRERVEYVKNASTGKLEFRTYFERLAPESDWQRLVRIFWTCVLFLPMVLNAFATAMFVLNGWGTIVGSVPGALPFAIVMFIASNMFNYPKVQKLASGRKYHRIISAEEFIKESLRGELNLENLRDFARPLLKKKKPLLDIENLTINQLLDELESIKRIQLKRNTHGNPISSDDDRQDNNVRRASLATSGTHVIESAWHNDAWDKISQEDDLEDPTDSEKTTIQDKVKLALAWIRQNPGIFAWTAICVLLAVVCGTALMAIKMIHFPDTLNHLFNTELAPAISMSTFFITLLAAVLPTQIMIIWGSLKQASHEEETFWRTCPDNPNVQELLLNPDIKVHVGQPDLFTRIRNKIDSVAPLLAKLGLLGKISQQFITAGLPILIVGLPGVLFGWTPPGAVLLALALVFALANFILFWPDAHGHKKLTSCGRKFFSGCGSFLNWVGFKLKNDVLTRYGSRMIKESEGQDPNRTVLVELSSIGGQNPEPLHFINDTDDLESMTEYHSLIHSGGTGARAALKDIRIESTDKIYVKSEPSFSKRLWQSCLPNPKRNS